MAKHDGTNFSAQFDIVTMEEQIQGLTALHLAVMHNSNCNVVETLVNHSGCDINKVCFRVHYDEDDSFCFNSSHWTPFQIAAMKGHHQILQVFLKDVRLYDYGMIHPLERYKPAKYNGIPALHLAAASGNPLAVKILLESGKINTLALDTLGNTALHYAASVGEDFMGCACFVSVRHYLRLPTIRKKDISDVMCCMKLLMQAGLDMGQPNTRGATPELGPSSTSELKLWWYEKMAKETKTNLVATANAISVTAALVATSFMGPLQPPLGVSTSTSPEEMWLNGYSEVNHVAVEVFLICDSLSFYLAIASIMLAVIPSLGIPKPRFSQKNMQFAVALLFASITFVICAFSAASIAILPEARNHKLLAIVTTIMGALVCLIALGLFFLRLLRLIKPKSKLVMRLNSASSNFLFHMW